MEKSGAIEITVGRIEICYLALQKLIKNRITGGCTFEKRDCSRLGSCAFVCLLYNLKLAVDMSSQWFNASIWWLFGTVKH